MKPLLWSLRKDSFLRRPQVAVSSIRVPVFGLHIDVLDSWEMTACWLAYFACCEWVTEER